ncbi:hypothetical protein AYO47_03530 [Planctomyces sp. SCGC AG-212-M04]|nr:hypothetical protein AYO47_03530 [Planctomyces sp. SCGC AG-212-M04]
MKYQFLHRAFFRPDGKSRFLDALDSGWDEDFCGVGYTQAFHKTQRKDLPYRVSVEFIAARLGQAIGLPIPPSAITRFQQSNLPCFSSLDFNFERTKFPPTIPDLLYKAQPLICGGLLAFDIWIANEDRHDCNLVADHVANPRHIQIYDHDICLLHGNDCVGVERLGRAWNELGIGGHVMLDEINSWHYLHEWFDRIALVPDYMIEDICWAAFDLAEEMTPDETLEVVDFLKWRKPQLERLVKLNLDEFEKLDPESDSLFGG